jgi:hypothetical protein
MLPDKLRIILQREHRSHLHLSKGIANATPMMETATMRISKRILKDVRLLASVLTTSGESYFFGRNEMEVWYGLVWMVILWSEKGGVLIPLFILRDQNSPLTQAWLGDSLPCTLIPWCPFIRSDKPSCLQHQIQQLVTQCVYTSKITSVCNCIGLAQGKLVSSPKILCRLRTES